MSFDKNSNFNREANFTGVKFGENKPVLEVELNELQEIQNEARADIVRDSIPSGFVQLGDLDFEYMKNNENQVKLKTDSVAYVNGYKINIPKDTIINIGKAPEKEAREDLVFLEVWKEEVTSDSVLTKNGGEGQVEIPNKIKDDRYPIETSHRVALKWRIRHVADVDFEKYSLDGFSTRYNNNNYLSQSNTMLTAQGGNDAPFDTPCTNFMRGFRPCSLISNEAYNYKNTIFPYVDRGLYISGAPTADMKLLNKTMDGYVYAIPMFRLYRKPSCGKSIPFEYNKINPKVDYSKFTALMKEEKVERVVNETIKGNSLVNLMDCKGVVSNFSSTVTTNGATYDKNTNSIQINIASVTSTPNYAMLGCHYDKFHNNIKAETPYTIIFNSVGSIHPIAVASMSGTSSYILFNADCSPRPGRQKVSFVSPTNVAYVSDRRLFFKFDSSHIVANAKIDIRNIMILEGDWTDKEIPEYFEGLKSLGEEEHNLIEVKTGVIDENTYDPCDGNVKLSTAPNVTHVMSDNTIIPTFEAEVKRGETKLSDLTAFGKLETVGDETIELTKIKGRTLQNLLEFKNINNSSLINSSKEIVVKGSNEASVSCAFGETPLLKSNTEYTVFVNIKKSTNYSSDKFVQLTFGDKVTQIYLGEGAKKVKFTTPSKITSYNAIFYFWEDYQVNEGSLTIGDFMLFEGDHTNTPLEELPYVEGIKSVGETEDNKVVVRRCAKNLFNKKEVKIYKGLYFNRASNGTVMRGLMTTSILFKNIPNTRLVISKKPTTRFAIAFTDSDTLYTSLPINNLIMNGDTSTELLIENSGSYKYMMAYIDNNNATDEETQSIIDSIQLEEVGSEISQATPFEPYKEYRQEIHLKEPLRSLPNGVCDEIVGNKVIRRVGKVILDGSENWRQVSHTGPVNTIYFEIEFKAKTTQILSDKFKSIKTVTGDEEGIIYASQWNVLGIRISTQKASDLNSFKQWLQANPTTVYYELANPVEEEIEHYYDKESVKTYQLEEPLRGLPNGVKDEIKEGVLIRRCDELVFNGTENWHYADTQNNADTCLFAFKGETKWNLKPTDVHSISHISTQFGAKTHHLLYYPVSEEGTSISESGTFYVRINKNKLETQNVAGFKTWLQSNLIRIVYEMDSPIEIPLKEVNSDTADFSHKKHFKEGNFLREIPGGVKDEVVVNKVITRLGRIKLTGSETWTIHTSHNKHLSFGLAVGTVNSINMGEVSRNTIISDKLPTSPLAFGSNDVGGIRYTNSIYISIDKTLLATPDATGFKAWLNKNPVTVIYELASYTEAEKTAENGLINPCHPFNTYCGSMYVGNGINEVLVENAIPKSEDIIINTPFREISGRDKVNDCRYKKVAEGYDTMDKTSKSANLVDTRNFVNFVSTPNVAKVDTNVYPITLKSPKIKFSIFSNGVAIADDKFAIRFCDKDLKEITWWAATKINREVELVPNFREIAYIRLYHNNLVSTNKTIDGICITYQDGDSSKLVPFVPCEVAFENTEENDIEDLRHQVSLTGFNYDQVLNESFDKLLRGEL